MPKLSDKTMEKRFPCDYCGETFRTRQGLSGHIQFKHGYYSPATKSKPTATDIDMVFISSKLKNLSIWQATTGASKSTKDSVAKLLFDWEKVRSLFIMLNIQLTEQDFKTYLLLGLAKLFN